MLNNVRPRVYKKKDCYILMFPRVEVCSFVSSTAKLLFHVSFSASFALCYSRLNCPMNSFKNIIRETGVVDCYN